MRACSALLGCLLGASQCAEAQDTWRRTYGGFGPDRAAAVRAVSDGGYIVVGSTGSFGTSGDGYVIRLDEEGTPLWSRFLGTGSADAFNDVQPIADGGFILAGNTSSPGTGYDGWLLRLSDQGQVEWQVTLGTAEWDFLNALTIAPDGIYAAGETFGGPTGDAEAWVVKVDPAGAVVWQRTYAGSGAQRAEGITAAMDGGCAFAGARAGSNGRSDALMVRIDADGDPLWEAQVATDSAEWATGIIADAGGGFVLCGTTRAFSPFSEMLLARVDGQGGSDWVRHIGQLADWEAHTLCQRSNGGFAVAGCTKAFGVGGKDMYLLLTNSMGAFDLGTTYGSVADDEALGVALAPDGGYAVAGYTDGFGPGSQAVFVVKSGPDALTASEAVVVFNDPVSVPEPGASRGFSIGPNPALAGQPITVFAPAGPNAALELLDAAGRRVAVQHAHPSAPHTFSVQEPGIYSLRLHTAQGASSAITVVVLGHD